MKKNLTSILIFLIVAVTEAQRPILFDFKLFNEGKKLTFHEVKLLEEKNFVAYSPTKTTIEQKSYWLKFKLLNNNATNSYYINTPFILFRDLELYYYLNDSLYANHVSINQPFDKKPIYSHALTLELPRTIDTLTCYLRFTSFWNNNFKFIISDTQNLMQLEVRDRIPEFFFIGVTFLGMTLSLLLYLYLREKSYLLYFFYSVSILFNRMVHNGDIFNYTSYLFEINQINEILILYSLSYVSLTIIAVLYFKSFLNIDKSYKTLNISIIAILGLRILLLVVYIFVLDMHELNVFNLFEVNINHRVTDLITLCTVLPMVYLSYKIHKKIAIIALFSILVIISGNVINFIGESSFSIDTYSIYLNLGSAEVVLFLFALGYRYHYLKKENEKSLLLIIDQVKESEALKDNLNKELEIKVLLRTEEIRKMNELLKQHNITLEHEVEDISKARLFQKNMSYEDFNKIFDNEHACLEFLVEQKWGEGKMYQCKRCNYGNYKIVNELSRRCRSCNYIESPTTNTLYENVKFSIHKAFYITYLASTGSKELTIEEISRQLDLRVATYWKFKKRVQDLIECTMTKKKHKDGWTHLIEYSIK